MQDPTLSALLSACVDYPADAASLAALADRLLDCSAEDRVEALRTLADQANRLKSAQQSFGQLEHAYDSRTVMAEYSHFGDADDKEIRYAEESLRRKVADHLTKALEDDRWYAVRFRLVTRPDEMNYFGPGRSRRLLRRMTVTMAPLDGGRIHQDG